MDFEPRGVLQKGCMHICRYIRLLFWIAISAFFAVACNHFMKGKDYTYEKKFKKLGDDIEQLLIDEGVCDSIQSCRKRELFFVSPYPGGTAIQTYEVLSKDVLVKITALAMDTFYENRNMKIIMSSYTVSNKEYTSTIFSKASPFYKFELDWGGSNE